MGNPLGLLSHADPSGLPGALSSLRARGAAASEARMVTPFNQIDCWVFDLDNTLYHPRHRLFDQIDAKMGTFIQQLLNCDAETARRIQKDHFHAHGTTLAGLMKDNNVEPETYLAFVHDIVLDDLEGEPGLFDALAALPGRRIVFTNGDADYGARVLTRLGIASLFDGIHDVRACGFVPKPAQAAYDSLVTRFSINPARSIFFEDMARNLKPAHALGFTTVWLDNGSESGDRDHDPDFIDHHIHDLVPFLRRAIQPESRTA